MFKNLRYFLKYIYIFLKYDVRGSYNADECKKLVKSVLTVRRVFGGCDFKVIYENYLKTLVSAGVIPKQDLTNSDDHDTISASAALSGKDE